MYYTSFMESTALAIDVVRKKGRRGRPATGHDPVTSIRLSDETRARMDRVLSRDESRADLVREAVERELRRRERGKGKR